MEALVRGIYEKVGVDLERKGDAYIDRHTGMIVLFLDNTNKRNETENNIQGDNSNLKALGWKPLKHVRDILEEISQHHR
jgi:GDP-D-mannose dehydratase